MPTESRILSVNGGSSSIKFALLECGGHLRGVLDGRIERIDSFSAALGGLGTLVFTGGIGENAPVIRSRVCDGLGFMGIELDVARNQAAAAIIIHRQKPGTGTSYAYG